ncbi:MAG: dTDP-4-dehydrorhamnose reductase [Candidatus Acidiferrum sp.]|jgi:dTDP-4-dehydrorhamnose reductase
MKLAILLVGKTGQVGWELHRFLPALGEVVAPDRQQLDLLNPDSIRRVVREVRPQLIVNAAAYTAVDAAETDEAQAHAINAEAPAVLADEGSRVGAVMVHYSTDYVFDGKKGQPYDEADPKSPLNVYGKTKLAGEEAVRKSAMPHMIFRTSWVYATRGRNFLLTILRLATEREELKIVDDQTGSPTCASDIAAATSRILTSIYERDAVTTEFARVAGTYHMTAVGQTTWYDFAKAILEQASEATEQTSWVTAITKGRPLITRRVLPITSDEYRSAAPRPAYSVLSNSLLARTFGFELPAWRIQLQKCFPVESRGWGLASTGCVPVPQ